MFFTGYQPQNSREEFCDDIPSTGQTVIALHMQDQELRNMLMEIRIIKDEGTHANSQGLPYLTDAELASKEILGPVTIVYLPPKKYPSGALTFEHTFPATGKFIGIVTVQNEHGQFFVSRFPFTVGQTEANLIEQWNGFAEQCMNGDSIDSCNQATAIDSELKLKGCQHHPAGVENRIGYWTCERYQTAAIAQQYPLQAGESKSLQVKTYRWREPDPSRIFDGGL